MKHSVSWQCRTHWDGYCHAIWWHPSWACQDASYWRWYSFWHTCISIHSTHSSSWFATLGTKELNNSPLGLFSQIMHLECWHLTASHYTYMLVCTYSAAQFMVNSWRIINTAMWSPADWLYSLTASQMDFTCTTVMYVCIPVFREVQGHSRTQLTGKIQKNLKRENVLQIKHFQSQVLEFLT